MEDFLIAYCVAGTVLGTAELRLRRTSFWAQRLVWWAALAAHFPPRPWGGKTDPLRSAFVPQRTGWASRELCPNGPPKPL